MSKCGALDMGIAPSGISARLALLYSLRAGTSIPSAEYSRILLRKVRTDTPSTRAARVRLPSQRASVCSTSSRSISPTVDPIRSGTTSFGAGEADGGISGKEAGNGWLGNTWVIDATPDQLRTLSG